MKLWKLKKSQERPLLATQILSKFQSEHGRMKSERKEIGSSRFPGDICLIVSYRCHSLLVSIELKMGPPPSML